MLPILNALTPLLGTVIDRVIPDKAAAERVQVELELQAAQVEADVQRAQLSLAKEDAKSGIGGFRWGAGWLCVISLAYAWIIRDILIWMLALSGSVVPPPPPLDASAQYVMLTGMLGLSGVRAFDLARGTRK